VIGAIERVGFAALLDKAGLEKTIELSASSGWASFRLKMKRRMILTLPSPPKM